MSRFGQKAGAVLVAALYWVVCALDVYREGWSNAYSGVSEGLCAQALAFLTAHRMGARLGPCTLPVLGWMIVIGTGVLVIAAPLRWLPMGLGILTGATSGVIIGVSREAGRDPSAPRIVAASLTWVIATLTLTGWLGVGRWVALAAAVVAVLVLAVSVCRGISNRR